MSKNQAKLTSVDKVSPFSKPEDHGLFQVYTHQANGLRLLHYPIANTGVVTSNITYQVGSVDEKRGESGLAHMLEHMLFKATKQDLKQNIKDGAAMQFERDTGSVLNANTSYDRTTYYFSFPQKYLDRVLELEANRMQDLVLDDAQFQPERSNVLSEFDMYNSDPYFALEVAMRCSMFQSHAYDHEVIGFREDIEDYTVEKLQKFYEMYYQPNNATLMLIGDSNAQDVMKKVDKYFGKKKNNITHIQRETAREPKISGPRTVSIERPGTTNLLAFGFLQVPFPSADWYSTELAFRIFAGGPESILHKTLVDSGQVSSLDHFIPASPQSNLGLLFLRLSNSSSHDQIKAAVINQVNQLTTADIKTQLAKEKTQLLTEEAFTRLSSLGLANELTQYAACSDMAAFSKTKTMLQAVTPTTTLQALHAAFTPQTLLTGSYRSL